ncbi:MAG: hypothetical protein AB1714_11915 [Acidobacteriota bacterium]
MFDDLCEECNYLDVAPDQGHRLRGRRRYARGRLPPTFWPAVAVHLPLSAVEMFHAALFGHPRRDRTRLKVRHGVLDPQVPFLQKPFSPAELAIKIREALNA